MEGEADLLCACCRGAEPKAPEAASECVEGEADLLRACCREADPEAHAADGGVEGDADPLRDCCGGADPETHPPAAGIVYTVKFERINISMAMEMIGSNRYGNIDFYNYNMEFV